MLFFPERIAALGVAVYVILALIAPLDIVFPISWGSLFYIVFCYVAFFLGCQVKHKKISQHAPQQNSRITRAFWFISALGTVGITLRLYDKWILRGAALASSAIESRELLEDATAGPLSALAGALYPFCFAPLIIFWATPKIQKSTIAKSISIILFVAPAIDALFLLSRSQILITLSMMYFAAACVLYKGKVLPRKLAIPIGLGITCLAAVSISVFTTRLNQMDMNLAYSIINSAYGHVVTPNTLAKYLMDSPTSYLSNTVAAILPMIQYYIHGVFEFGLLWDRPDPQTFSHGTLHFAPYLKLLNIAGITQSTNAAVLFYRPGVFTTFFGPLWVDFGWAGPLFMSGFGFLCKTIANEAKKGGTAALPIHAFFCVVIFFMPVVNFLISAQGMYIASALLLIWVAMTKKIVL